VLIDTNSSQKGDGIKYYLYKDETSKKYFDEYQKGTKIKWKNVVPGTIGTLLTLAGFVFDIDDRQKRTFIISGLSLFTINFLVSKTLEYNNEQYLLRAIEEYNKRNLPTIHFSPIDNSQIMPSNLEVNVCPTILINYTRSF